MIKNLSTSVVCKIEKKVTKFSGIRHKILHSDKHERTIKNISDLFYR